MRKQTVIFGVLAGVIVCLAIAQPNATQTRTTNNTKAENGRWQIVNGTPELSRNIMLLDTQTGDSRITCDGADGTGWCALPRTYIQVSKPLASKSSVPQPSESPMPKCLRYDKNGYCAEFEPPKP